MSERGSCDNNIDKFRKKEKRKKENRDCQYLFRGLPEVTWGKKKSTIGTNTCTR